MTKEAIKTIWCPVDDISCPYYRFAGVCTMDAQEGCEPFAECDAWDGMTDEEIESYVDIISYSS